jgi:hypothetical protein
VKRYDKNFQRSTIALLAIVFSVAQTRRYGKNMALIAVTRGQPKSWLPPPPQ